MSVATDVIGAGGTETSSSYGQRYGQRYGKCCFWDEQTVKQELAETLWCFPAWAS